jgi:diguanylate cyclase (GGDEF)-like protein
MARLFPVFDSTGTLTHYAGVKEDITERKLVEKALEESNHKFETLSITDGLTGIANRRRFEEVLAQEYGRHCRSGAELSLIMLDIDHFKAFNDNYGHIIGDECLRQIARVIADCAARPADLTARYGGEEFACILPETDPSGAVAIAEKIRRCIMTRAISHRGSNLAYCVTASLGVATIQCTTSGSAVDIVAQADEQLYRAKSCGRNRVEFVAVHNAAKTSVGGNR